MHFELCPFEKTQYKVYEPLSPAIICYINMHEVTSLSGQSINRLIPDIHNMIRHHSANVAGDYGHSSSVS